MQLKKEKMNSIRLNVKGLLKISLPILCVVIVMVIFMKNKTNTQVGDRRCSLNQRRDGVKCPSISKTIPPQSSDVVRVVLLSDTHGFHNGLDIPDGDIFIHGGDILNLKNKNWTDQVKEFDVWLKKLPHRHKILVPGNHDPLLDPNLRLIEAGLIKENFNLKNAIVLAGEDVTVEGVSIAGLPHTPVPPDKKKSWPYGVKNDEEMADQLVKFPAVDIFISHNPPWHIGSFNTLTWGEEGSQAILHHVLMTKPKVHMFGHTHQGRGVYSFLNSNTVFINTAYETRGIKAAVVVDLKRGSRRVEGVYMQTDFFDQFQGINSELNR